MRVAELLHAYGTPSHRLERVLVKIAKSLKIKAQFLSTPTSLIAAFGEGENQRTHLVRVDPTSVDLGKLVEFDEIMEDVEQGRIQIREGLVRLESVAHSGARYGPWLRLLAFGVASASAARFFGGGLEEVILSLMIGVVTGLVDLLIQRRRDVVDIFEPLAAFLAGFLSISAVGLGFAVSSEIVTLSGLIVLIPGLTLTVAMIELATRHLVAGMARFAGAATIFLMIALGVALARKVGAGLFPVITSDQIVSLPGWTEWIALGLAPVAFLVLFQARVRELPVVFITGVVGFLGARLGTMMLGAEIGSCLGALLVGLLSNGYARLFNRPASVPLMPGILILVPGSVGFRSLSFFLEQDAISGMEAAFQTALMAVSLVGGLLAANVLVPPRRVL